MSHTPNTLEERMNKLKMCLLCRHSEEWPLTEMDVNLHEKFGLHSTFGYHWAPLKGHPQYELHQRTFNTDLIKLRKEESIFGDNPGRHIMKN